MDILDKVKELQNEDVIITDLNSLLKNLHSIANDGPEKLQILADFDGTLTKWSLDGKVTPHSLDIFQMTEGLSEAYCADSSALERKHAVAYNEAQTIEEKQQIMTDWLDELETLLRGERVTVEDIHRAVDTADHSLREGTQLMFHMAESHQVPVTVISAGIGEVVEYSLRQFKPKIMANFMTLDNGRIVEFIKPIVRVNNKHEFNFPMNNSRQNVIVLGDSIWDSKMADSVPEKKAVIKIGFLNDVGQKMKLYSELYDVVLLNDQSMDAVNALLKMVLESNQ